MAAGVGLDPDKDIDWVADPLVEPMQLFAEGRIDAFLGFPPEPQELRARKVGHVVVNSAVDRPWSQYFCCLLAGRREFVRDHPIATKRVTRAVLKAADLCVAEPERMAQRLVEDGFTKNYDYAIQTLTEAEAEKLATKWLTKYRVQIKSLSDERQEVYRQIREMSAHPMDVDLARPTSWMQPTTMREANGRERPLPRFAKHFLCADDGLFPEDFHSSWEGDVVRAELQRTGTLAWYRNPSRASQDSLGITYEEGEAVKIVRPDFIFFAELTDGSIVADIVDPHGIQFTDAISKLKGLARYAENYGSVYRRVDVVAKLSDKFRVLDLTEPNVRSSIEAATSIRALYESEAATDYML